VVRRRILGIGVLLAAAGAPALQAEPLGAIRARNLAATCAACHGTDGRSVPGESMVRLAGQPKGSIAAQLRAFRDGQRPATVMHQLAKGYSDAQIDAIAGHLEAVR
jgi:cytochrome c553